MGASQSASSPFAACRGGNIATQNPSGPRIIGVVRSSAWGMGGDEDVWHVEMPREATIVDLKAKIEELYDVPRHAQKLVRSNDPSAPALDDTDKVDTLERQRVHLLPAPVNFASMGLGATSPEQQDAMQGMAQAFLGAAQESMETSAAIQESLRGVTYKVCFHRPADAGGRAAGKTISLDLDALATVGDMQQMVEVELFGSTGAETVFLTFEGHLLPPHFPLHHVGIDDGTTVEVAKDMPALNDHEQLLAGLLGGAGVGAGGAMSPEQFLGGLLGGNMGANGGMQPEHLQQILGGLVGTAGMAPGVAPVTPVNQPVRR